MVRLRLRLRQTFHPKIFWVLGMGIGFGYTHFWVLGIGFGYIYLTQTQTQNPKIFECKCLDYD